MVYQASRLILRERKKGVKNIAATVPAAATKEFLAALSSQKAAVLLSYIYTQ